MMRSILRIDLLRYCPGTQILLGMVVLSPTNCIFLRITTFLLLRTCWYLDSAGEISLVGFICFRWDLHHVGAVFIDMMYGVGLFLFAQISVLHYVGLFFGLVVFMEVVSGGQ